MTERWVHVSGGNLYCSRCHKPTPAAWKWFVNATTWTHCLCEACAEAWIAEARS
jgi:hypothetical protein